MLLSNKSSLQLFGLAIIMAATARILNAQSSVEPAVPTGVAACTTGPTMQESNSIFVNGRQYLSDIGEVECNGHITEWSFCHYVIGFRHLEMELWAGAWRLTGDQYELVGLNVITVEAPGYDEDQLRCVEFQIEALEWIEVQEGDYIGFFLPDNGVFVASASAQSDPGRRQMQRSIYGYAENFNESEVEVAASSFGRALLSATIDSTVEKPVTVPTKPPTTSHVSPLPPTTSHVSPLPPTTSHVSPLPTSSLTPSPPPLVEGTTTSRGSSRDSIVEIAVPVVALMIIITLLGIITVLIILLRRRRTVVTTLHPLPHPLSRAVDATNPTTGTSDNGSVLYEAIYSQAYLQARDMPPSEVGYSMISNPAYRKGSDSLGRVSLPDIPEVTSPPVHNPTYTTTAKRSTGSLIRYPQVIFKSRRNSTLPGSPLSPPPTIPAPVCPAPPPPPLPYVLSQSSSSRPPTLPLNEETPSSTASSAHLKSPPSPYCNPYQFPRPRSPTSIYETPVPPQTLSASSTMTRASEQSSGDTQSASSTVSTSSTDIDTTAQ